VKTQIKTIHIKIRMEEYVMRVSTKICLEKEKKKHPHQQKTKKKIPFETMCSMRLKSLQLSFKALWSL
jgi:hypothetical protein